MITEKTTETLFITGAGISAESGIPTFRGVDGFWTVGSRHYTPQQMATRRMYQEQPAEFLLWYYRRFAQYRHCQPNDVHLWLKDRRLITQNIDGLDGKAGHRHYIPIHGRLDKVTVLHEQGEPVALLNAPWDEEALSNVPEGDDEQLKRLLLDFFRISSTTQAPEINTSLKPFVLLFDEYYTPLYRISQAQQWMQEATTFVFMGTSLSVGITEMALNMAAMNKADIHIVDPQPVDLQDAQVRHHLMTAEEYIAHVF